MIAKLSHIYFSCLAQLANYKCLIAINVWSDLCFPFSKMCFRAWLHDVKLELHNKQKEKRVVEKHFIIWKKRISLNTIASEMVRTDPVFS